MVCIQQQLLDANPIGPASGVHLNRVAPRGPSFAQRVAVDAPVAAFAAYVAVADFVFAPSAASAAGAAVLLVAFSRRLHFAASYVDGRDPVAAAAFAVPDPAVC